MVECERGAEVRCQVQPEGKELEGERGAGLLHPVPDLGWQRRSLGAYGTVRLEAESFRAIAEHQCAQRQNRHRDEGAEKHVGGPSAEGLDQPLDKRGEDRDPTRDSDAEETHGQPASPDEPDRDRMHGHESQRSLGVCT